MLLVWLVLGACVKKDGPVNAESAVVRQDSAELVDADGDGVADDDDCEPEDALVFPGAAESCDDVDQDCDGKVDEGTLQDAFTDQDQDGYGAGERERVCELGQGQSWVDGDCDDGDPGIHPGADEACNGLDDDCDSLVDEGLPTEMLCADQDGDGHGDVDDCSERCDDGTGAWVASADDCDDGDPGVYTGATEYCDDSDSDCDGDFNDLNSLGCSTYAQDGDNDEYAAEPVVWGCVCEPDATWGASEDEFDCDDTLPGVNPGATEVCDGIDNDCDEGIDEGC